MSRGRGNPYARPDARTRAAKAAGYPARSVWKLREIDERLRLLRPGQRVLDLGAAPGSWTLYASERVGPRGRVVAIDQRPIELPAGEGLTLLTGDLLAPELPAELLGAAPYQVVLSDMAPSTTGSRVTDQARSLELFLRALSVADRVAAPGGAFVGKLFMSADFPAARRAVETRHEETRVVKPEGTRSNSVEVFVIGLRRRPSPGAAPPAPG